MITRKRRPAFSGNLPDIIPVFPLADALLLPRGQMPLNIFEPRYIEMIDDALAGDRIIGMIQPEAEDDEVRSIRRCNRSAAPAGLRRSRNQ